VKRICRYLPILSVALFCVPFASAQSSVDFMLGFGTAHDKAAASGLEASATGLSQCSTPGAVDTSTLQSCLPTPSLSGFFLGFGGDVIVWKNVGFGAEVGFQPGKSQFINSPDFGPLNYRQTFYDFNGIYEPVHSKRVSLQLQAGPGGAKTSLSQNQSSCVGSACVSETVPVVNSNHFQVHAGVGVSFFVTEHIFIRPQFDIHYVPNLTSQPGFGSDLVTAGMVWVGYNFGSR
jgi:hypothetical protein